MKKISTKISSKLNQDAGALIAYAKNIFVKLNSNFNLSDYFGFRQLNLVVKLTWQVG